MLTVKQLLRMDAPVLRVGADEAIAEFGEDDYAVMDVIETALFNDPRWDHISAVDISDVAYNIANEALNRIEREDQ